MRSVSASEVVTWHVVGKRHSHTAVTAVSNIPNALMETIGENIEGNWVLSDFWRFQK